VYKRQLQSKCKIVFMASGLISHLSKTFLR
jgi:hypothetical protein